MLKRFAVILTLSGLFCSNAALALPRIEPLTSRPSLLKAQLPSRQLVTTVRSEGAPKRGQKHRSSGNFSTDTLPAGYSRLCWEIGQTTAKVSRIKFNVKKDKSLRGDSTEFKNLGHGSKTKIKKSRQLYIADPRGAYDSFGNKVGFLVEVYACK
ncbi:hypothetical protein [Calothrix sp. CCY 0018]|uniref:hypothetical protein n=1 Tax=Calothrix sp. CCY 0018 TaxID=3103864 RepID=UPI0039C64025